MTDNRPTCLTQIGDETYRCARYGFTLRNPVLPIRCSGCAQESTTYEPRLPSVPRQALNLAKALLEFAADGCKTVTREQYEERLRICDGCELLLRDQWRCTHASCGCFLRTKANGRVWKCPLNRWPEVPDAD
jgi:hypothetical protein